MARGPQVKIPRRAGGEKTPEVRWGNRPTYPTVRVSFSLRVPLRNLFHFSMRPPGFFTTVDPRSKSSSGPLRDPPPSPTLKIASGPSSDIPGGASLVFTLADPQRKSSSGPLEKSPSLQKSPAVPRWSPVVPGGAASRGPSAKPVSLSPAAPLRLPPVGRQR